MKMGRPSKFNDSLESVAIALAVKGHIDREIAEIIGVSESALNEHKKRKPDFHEALKLAKNDYDNSIVEQALLKRAIGLSIKETQIRNIDGKQVKTVIEKELPPDTAAMTLFLRNRMPEKYCRERQNIAVGIEDYKSLTMEEAKQIILSDPFNS